MVYPYLRNIPAANYKLNRFWHAYGYLSQPEHDVEMTSVRLLSMSFICENINIESGKNVQKSLYL